MADTQRWEYKSLSLGSFWSTPKDEDVEAALNEAGLEGWEAVNAFYDQNSNRMRVVLKRPLTDEYTRRQRRSTWPG
jgi:hypothetical protein